DLFVQENSGSIIFFENIGSPIAAQFRWRSDKYQNLDVGEWYRFVDIDQDGDVDLLGEEPFSFVRVYLNEGTRELPEFRLATDTLRDANGEPIFSDRQNIPQVSDIDCDGMLDLFVGRLTGTITHFESVTGAGGVPSFAHVTDRFQNIEIVAQFGSAHGANTMALVDFDRDGDEDLFWGDFFEPGVLLVENRGECGRPVLTGSPEPFPRNMVFETSGYNAPVFTDIDGDEDWDLFVGVLGGAFNINRSTRDNFYFLERLEDGVFVERSKQFVRQLDVGSESYPVFVDLDGDNDQDLLLSNKIDPDHLRTSRVYRFENVGTANSPAFRARGSWFLDGLYHYAPSFGDLDADGDLDMILGSWRGEVALYWNTGSATAPRFEDNPAMTISLSRGSNTTPAVGDIDGDGDLDLMVGEASGTLNYYVNDGTSEAPQFTLVSDQFLDVDVGRRSAPTLADVDSDGDLDLVVGSENGGAIMFLNQSAGGQTVFAAGETMSLNLPLVSTPVFIDIDNDGDLDVFSGGLSGGMVFLENRTNQ
ncbi:MAG: VCBS repeat-containing protein, partial [Gemmatimonadota bacterium]|nr:VCBS repeat-containing protein [Gemmatimonadota bacterium]